MVFQSGPAQDPRVMASIGAECGIAGSGATSIGLFTIQSATMFPRDMARHRARARSMCRRNRATYVRQSPAASARCILIASAALTRQGFAVSSAIAGTSICARTI